MAIFAASYAVPQCDSLDGPGAGFGGGLADDEGSFRKRCIGDASVGVPFRSEVGCRGQRIQSLS